ncbi:MAG: transketolase [Chloroflexi bacterium]|nr:transketolase [Chloroflexota bacterium]
MGPDADLATRARYGRWLVVRTVASSGAGHIGGPLSAMDLWVALYFRVLNIRPADPAWPHRDRFILSKGHSAIGLYAVMAQRGYFPVDELATFDRGDSRLQGHPDMTCLPGLDASTGSLGQGLAVGVGIALGARLRGLPFRTWVMLGDGECQEGMVWEATLAASRLGLENLMAIVDVNGLQQYGLPKVLEASRGDRREPWPGDQLRRVFQSFDWRVLDVDGHDFDSILAACDIARDGKSAGRPTVILARTIKGRGLSFMEGRHAWHARIPTPDEVEQARLELGIDESGRPA